MLSLNSVIGEGVVIIILLLLLLLPLSLYKLLLRISGKSIYARIIIGF